MSDLFGESPAAAKWLNEVIRKNSPSIFGKLVPAVIWTDERNEDGTLRSPIDPSKLASSFNSQPTVLLHNHDPGSPKGQVIESAVFKTETGRMFVAAVLGYYEGGDVLSFCGLGIDIAAPVPPPKNLPDLPVGVWIEIATDPREVDEAWVTDVANGAPLRVQRTELSHNALESHQELIRVGLAYLVIVWNPFITAVASEAGKATFAATRDWLRKLLRRLADRRNPILALQTFQDSCQVSFLFRGKEVKRHYAAHDALSAAATQAAQLIENLKGRGIPARELTYEFDVDALLWYPAYALLNDGRIVTDKSALISLERLPQGLSLGIRKSVLSPIVNASQTENGK